MPDFLPRPEGKLLAWSNNFSALINAAPGDYGLSVEQAAHYAVLHDAFAAAYAKTARREIRSMVTVAAKNAAMGELKSVARQLSMIIKGTSSVTSSQRIDLGLNPGNTHAARIHSPAAPPSIQIVEVHQLTATITISDHLVRRLGKPPGVHGAIVFRYIGDRPPTDTNDWEFHSTTTARKVRVDFPGSTPPGQRVWFSACWINARLQRGPFCPPAGTNLPGGGVQISAVYASRAA